MREDVIILQKVSVGFLADNRLIREDNPENRASFVTQRVVIKDNKVVEVANDYGVENYQSD